jgi:hypothetical protein
MSFLFAFLSGVQLTQFVNHLPKHDWFALVTGIILYVVGMFEP